MSNGGLFEHSCSNADEPLAARMRPRNLDEYIGQDHIVGKGRLLRRAIQADRLSSIILSGPPGTGKTTLARVIANHTKSNFLSLNAVLTGVQQIRDAIAAAEENKNLYGRRTILFVDEVHRWNRAQQDALLPWVENGTIIFIGATTENPFFEVNKALVSRSRIFQLSPLTEEDLKKAALVCLNDKERGYGKWNIEFEENALEHIISSASGDARSLLNAVELAVETSVPHWPPAENTIIKIGMDIAEESIRQKAVLYDRDGDYHYDAISAFIKSIRGSDPDAALYWLARMISAGESPRFIFRRMLISASEDIGLAEPEALTVVAAAAEAFDRVGMPEGQYHLAHAAVYLAACPKSNSLLGFFDALSAVEKENSEVPNHLKDANRDKEELGHGKGYLYPHSYKEHWVGQQYLPDNMIGRVFYTPGSQGFEKHIRDDVLSKREAQLAALIQKTQAGFESEHDTSKDIWLERAETNTPQILNEIRSFIFEKIHLKKNDRVLVYGADDNLLIWYALRKTPDGCTVGLCRTEKSCTVLQQYAETLEELLRPLLGITNSSDLQKNIFDITSFDYIISYNPEHTRHGFINFFHTIKTAAEPFTRILFAVKLPQSGLRLAEIIKNRIPKHDEDTVYLLEEFSKAEKDFFSSSENDLFNWDETFIEKEASIHGFTIKCEKKIFKEKKLILKSTAETWLSNTSLYGNAVRKAMGSRIDVIEELLYEAVKEPVIFPSCIAFFSGTKSL